MGEGASHTGQSQSVGGEGRVMVRGSAGGTKRLELKTAPPSIRYMGPGLSREVPSRPSAEFSLAAEQSSPSWIG